VQPSINYARQIGYNTLRSAVTADKAAALTGGERDKLRALVREELELGALGLSYGLAYAPACFSRTEELVDVAEEAAAQHAFISFHLRNEDNTLLESLDEALHIGRASGAKVHVGHLKTFRRPNWHKLDAALSRLDDARTAGMDLTVDRYPHTAMNTQLKFILPTWALEGGIDKTKARLVDKEARAKVIAELKTYDEEVREVLIALVSKAENKHLEGRFLDDIASSDGKEPWDVICDILAVEGDNAFATFFGMSRDNLDRIVALDYAMIASDASVQAVDKQMGGGAPHPRCFDTFPYFLAEWVFARKTFTLEEAVRKMTSLPARRAGIVDRGVVAEGAFADLALIDPHGLKPDVSYEHPIRYPPGVETVIVNGEVTIRDGRHLEARAGRLLTR
jgi:N-acyl-D-amino-acid deacylase